MNYTCSICGYTSSRAFNYNRHLKTHEQLSNRASEHSLSTREHSPSTRVSEQLSKRAIEQKAIPTLEHISENDYRVNEHTDNDLPVITDEVLTKAARELNRIPKAIPKKVMREISHTDNETDTISKPDSKLGLGIFALILTGLFLVIFWKDIKKFLESFKGNQSGYVNNSNAYGFSITRE